MPSKFILPFRQRNVHAMSLVELLVSIAIISILLSLLLPVLGKVRRTAHETRCLANL